MKTIMISDDAYQKLAAIKGKKSFTDLISEIVDAVKQKKKDDIMKFAGIINDEEAKEMEQIVRQVRGRARARI